MYARRLLPQSKSLNSNYDDRTMPWVNIYSRNDWIGGELALYGTKAPDPICMVDNREDLEARAPLAAHSGHWGNTIMSSGAGGGDRRADARRYRSTSAGAGLGLAFDSALVSRAAGNSFTDSQLPPDNLVC